MTTRRSCLIGLSAFAAWTGAAHANLTYDVIMAGRPHLIRGHPDKVAFGHGLIVPLSEDAFHALWEGDDRWIAYGHGFGAFTSVAMAQAEDAAIGTMKLYLITLAFAPERLMQVEGGGWRLKSNNVDDLVRGEIMLPGRPVRPAIDEIDGALIGKGKSKSGKEVHVSAGVNGGVAHASTGWLVWKKDVTLDYVRANARLVPP